MKTPLIKLITRRHPDPSLPESREKIGSAAGLFGILCNILLFGIKLAAGLLSGSISVVSDAFNNLSDAGSSVITLIGFKLSTKPADPQHPYGHGRIEYVSGFLVSVIIILVGTELLKTSVKGIFSPTPVETGTLTIVILVISICIKLYMCFFDRTVGKVIDSAGLAAAAADSLSDCAATGAVLLSVIISMAFDLNIDAYAGVLVSGFIIWQGIKTAGETLNPLLGEPPSAELVKELEDRVLSYDGFLGTHDLMIHNYGPGRSFASIHVEVPADIDINACHETIDKCEKEVGQALGMLIVIHMDPIDVNDDAVAAARGELCRVLDGKLGFPFSIHDFRMVRGENQSNLIFDIVVPAGTVMSDGEITDRVSELARSLGKGYECVITVDRDYTGR